MGGAPIREKPLLICISAGIYDMRLNIDARQLPLHKRRQIKHMMAGLFRWHEQVQIISVIALKAGDEFRADLIGFF